MNSQHVNGKGPEGRILAALEAPIVTVSPEDRRILAPLDPGETVEEYMARRGFPAHNGPAVSPLSAADLIVREIAAPACIGGPFNEKQYLFFYAEPGVGKTFFSYGFGLSAALGEGVDFCGWRFGGRPRRVLYVDGEMSLYDMKRRLCVLLGGQYAFDEDEPPAPPFSIVSNDDAVDSFGKRLPQLDQESGRAWFEQKILETDAEIVVFDNLASLWHGDENATEAMIPLVDWLTSLRATGRTVALIHHANKNKGYRGSTALAGPADIVVKLERPERSPHGQLRAKLLFEKGRGYGTDAFANREIWLEHVAEPDENAEARPDPAWAPQWFKHELLRGDEGEGRGQKVGRKRKVSDEDFRAAVQEHGRDVDKLASELNLSRSSVYSRLKEMDRGLAAF